MRVSIDSADRITRLADGPETSRTAARQDLDARLRTLSAGHPSEVHYAGKRVDTRSERNAWDVIRDEGQDCPSPEPLRLTVDRRDHIVDGDADGGGHRHGTGRPDKTEFPATWSDDKIAAHVLDVARNPDAPPRYQNRNDRWLARGTRDDVEIVAVVTRDAQVWAAWPTEGSPGVVRNKIEER